MLADAIDLSTALIGSPDCPDVRTWPIRSALDKVLFSAEGNAYGRGNVLVNFAGRDTLPAAQGSQGPIAYTLWMGFFVKGQWRLLPLVECINTYIPTGPLFADGHLGANLTYYAAAPLTGYQPKHAEDVLIFVTGGDTRRQNAQAGPEWRTSALFVQFRPGIWTGEAAAEPAPTLPAPEPPAPVIPAPAPMDVAALLQHLDTLERGLAAANAALTELLARSTPAPSVTPLTRGLGSVKIPYLGTAPLTFTLE